MVNDWAILRDRGTPLKYLVRVRHHFFSSWICRDLRGHPFFLVLRVASCSHISLPFSHNVDGIIVNRYGLVAAARLWRKIINGFFVSGIKHFVIKALWSYWLHGQHLTGWKLINPLVFLDGTCSRWHTNRLRHCFCHTLYCVLSHRTGG